MRPMVMVFFFLLAGLCGTQKAMASRDILPCAPAWKPAVFTMPLDAWDSMCSNRAMLAPSNDTRVNLLLLMADLNVPRYKAAFAAPPRQGQDAPLFTVDDISVRFGGWPENAPSAAPANDDNTQDKDGKCPATFARADGFPNAVKADSALPPGERDALLAARLALRCKYEYNREKSVRAAAAAAFTDAVKTVQSPSGKAFSIYLLGADSFWQGDYQAAANFFTSLARADAPWLKETALYMLGRVAINRAQVGAFDDYGYFKDGWKAERKLVAEAQTALDNYLQAYPKGVYALSARGLKRRGWWLGGIKDKLAEEYTALMAMDPKGRNASDPELAGEIDNKMLAIFPRGQDYPIFARDIPLAAVTILAVADLGRMRRFEKSQDSEVNYDKPVTRAELEAQKQAFAGNMPLYEYLLAAYAFYVENKPAEVLRLIPDAARQSSFSYLEFSRQMLRGLALEAVKDRKALDFWWQMLPGSAMPYQRSALELAIAFHHERAGTVSKVFDDDSPVHYPYLRQVLLLNIADAALLRQQVQNTKALLRERDKALFTLLYKEATRGFAADFLQDMLLVPSDAPVEDGTLSPDGNVDLPSGNDDSKKQQSIPLGLFRQAIGEKYGCPSMVEVQTRLAKNSNDPKALLCVAEFVRTHIWVIDELDTQPAADLLGGSRSLFAGRPYARMRAYQSVLANPKASADDKAYALYRAVWCYGPSGNNDCGGEKFPLAQRKAWFQRLKRNYPSSGWAKELKYYW